MMESIRTNNCAITLDVDGVEVVAVIECRVIDVGDALGNGHCTQTLAVRESKTVDGLHAIGDDEFFHFGTVQVEMFGIIQRIGVVVSCTYATPCGQVGDVDSGQAVANIKSIVTEVCDTAGDGHRLQSVAVVESPASDSLHALSECQFCQLSTLIKRIVTDGLDIVANHHGG